MQFNLELIKHIPGRNSINCFFLNQNYLVQKETLAALRRLPGVSTKALDITIHPDPAQAAYALEILKSGKCSVLFTINEWGLDCCGSISEYIEKNKMIHINWCVDDPFYEELTGHKKFVRSPLRFDFVSDQDYISKMTERGYQVSFLPLAADPGVFYPETVPQDKDVVFVGNSYLAQLDLFIEDVNDAIQRLIPFIASLVDEYRKDCLNVNLEGRIVTFLEKNEKSRSGADFDKLVFVCKQVAGYLYRKDIISGLLGTFSKFMLYGDDGWKNSIGIKKVNKVSYGDDLRKLYNSVRVNIDCNRAVIKDGLTQRIFDVLACRKFVVTSNKMVVNELFETDGPQREVVMFRNREELIDLVRYYIDNEKERDEIARRGYARVLNEHTYDHRIKTIFKIISSSLKNM